MKKEENMSEENDLLSDQKSSKGVNASDFARKRVPENCNNSLSDRYNPQGIGDEDREEDESDEPENSSNVKSETTEKSESSLLEIIRLLKGVFLMFLLILIALLVIILILKSRL